MYPPKQDCSTLRTSIVNRSYIAKRPEWAYFDLILNLAYPANFFNTSRVGIPQIESPWFRAIDIVN